MTKDPYFTPHPQGERTITLHDIVIFLRLLVDESMVIGNTFLDWRHVSHFILRLIPKDGYIDGQSLHLTWLNDSFLTLAPNIDKEFI